MEAEKRGLVNLKTTPDACDTYTLDKNIKLFEKSKVFTLTELKARQHIMFENYSRIINIEGLTMAEMAKKDIYPAVNKYISKLIHTAERKQRVGADNEIDLTIAKKLADLNTSIYKKAEKLTSLLEKALKITDAKQLAFYYKDKVIPCMKSLRAYADEAETYTPETLWPFPTYGQLLFSVR
jgi:glutamine synthetase